MRIFGGLQFVLGFPEDYIKFDVSKLEERHYAAYQPQLNRGLGSMYVYCNICENTQIGDVFAPLLRQITLPNNANLERGLMNKITLDYPMYIPVRLSTINNIEIEIRTNSGHYFPFIVGSTTTITLHFKKQHG
jgi:hypothetical protein